MSFLAELKRRRVVRVALLYGAVAFAVLEAGDVIFPLLRLPEWALSLVLGLLVLGFPIALVLAWAFQITPEGVQRTRRREGADSAAPVESAPTASAAGPIAHETHSWLSVRTTAVVILLVAAGVVMGGWFGSWRAARADADGRPARSIAVLPFASRSAAGEDADFFAAGLHDELLTQLSRIQDLAVTSRTSVMQYAGHDRAIRDIARELRVAYVLEGGVQRAGDRLRLNMQLIDGATDRHMWAETYDQVLTVANVFAIQAEIAAAIASALRAELGGATRSAIARAPTQNLDAYDAYLRGLARGVWDYTPDASQAFEDAVRLDPGFAPAWAALARARSWRLVQAVNGIDVGGARELSAGAHEAAARALALAPDALETRLALGYVAYYVDRELERALDIFEGIRRAAPGDPQIDLASGLILIRIGRFDDGIALFEKALAADPRNADITSALAEAYTFVGRFDEASQQAESTIAINPRYADGRLFRVNARAFAGDTAAARRVLAEERRHLSFRMMVNDGFPILLDEPAAAREQWLRELAQHRDSIDASRYHLMAARLAHFLRRGALQRAHADSLRRIAEPLREQIGSIERASETPSERLLRSSILSMAALAYAYLDREADARASAREAVAAMPRTVDAKGWWGPHESMLEALVVLGRYDDAVEVMRELIAHPSPWSPRRLRTDPMFAPMREHAGFRALVGRTP